jgi:hypothetical protein
VGFKDAYPLVEGLTGVDVFSGSAGKQKGQKNFMRGLGSADAEKEAARLRKASDDFKGYFGSDDDVKRGFKDYVDRLTAQRQLALFELGPADELFTLAQAVAAKKKKPSELAAAVFRDLAGPAVAGTRRPTKAERAEVASFFVQMLKVYAQSKTAKPDAIASGAGQLAKFGLLNLDPRVIAALSSTDGGGLVWLGAQTGGNKDFMHFELPDDDLPKEVKNAAPIQRAPADAGTTDAGKADAGSPSTPLREGGDTSSKKVVLLAWTFDDGPNEVTAEMEKAAPVAGTWFVMRNEVGKGPPAANALTTLKKKQDAGQEIGIHSMHPTKSHVAWFPHGGDEAYPDVKSAMSDLSDFKDLLTGAGIDVHFARAPYGIETELMNYLAAEGVPEKLRKDSADAIVHGTPYSPPKPKPAKATGDAGTPDAGPAGAGRAEGGHTDAGTADAGHADAGSPADPVAAAVASVRADFEFVKQRLAALKLHEWGGTPGQDPAVQGWEAESEPEEISQPKAPHGLTNDVISRFEGTVKQTAKTGALHSLVILTHDTKLSTEAKKTAGFRRADKVAQDLKQMEAFAKSQGVRLEYVTMSDLYQRRAGSAP